MQPDPHAGSHLPAGPSQHHDRPHSRAEGYEASTSNGHHGDASPLPPTSPNLTSAFHRPHHTANDNDASTMPSLRRRITQPQDEVIRVAIATPFSDGARRKERDLAVDTSVAQLKDCIAQDDEGMWERNGMRLVWQGRIVRDEEVLSDIVGPNEKGQVHTFHLVARRTPGRSTSFAPRHTPTTTAPDPAPATSATPIPPIPSAPLSRDNQALSDSVHFVLFLVRHHLCCLLNMKPLAWDDVIPGPLVSQDVAKQAVMSVIQAYATEFSSREAGWEGWEKGFDEPSAVKWGETTRSELETEVRSLWSERVGRAWKDGPEGEEVSVEFDELTYKLHLPPLSLMTPKQLVHLTLYLRLTSLLPLLNNRLTVSNVLSSIAQRTSALASVLATPSPMRVRRYGLHLRVNSEILWNVVLSAIEVGAMLWMLTRDMKWSDFKMWIIAGGLIGYWVGDAVNQLRPNLIWNNGNNPLNANRPAQAGPGGPAVPLNANAGVQAQAGVDAPRHTAAAAAAGILQNPPRQPPQTGTLLNRMVPLIHLDEDSVQLHLARERPRSQPVRLVTQLLLPIALWFITLIPEWESLRARAIRRRERAMRVWVEELITAREAEENAQRSADDTDPIEVGSGIETERPATAPVFPPGLSEKARKYFERVVARGEGIDWEEEREAQRAMGVAEEEDNNADGAMRMRML